MPWFYYTCLLIVLLVGLFVNILGLPGLWLMVAAYAAYGWITVWNRFVGWPSLIALIVLALLAEAAEFLAGAAGSKAAGGRKRGMIGAIVGGFLGAIFLSVIPIPVVAQIIGACLGAFIGAAVMELSDKGAAHSLRVGVGAAKGRFMGIISKLGFGVAMLIVALWAGLPAGGTASPLAPLPAPATPAPATPAPSAPLPPADASRPATTTSPATLPVQAPF
jgi:uncharacterized protein YqgC (DUF456 family)